MKSKLIVFIFLGMIAATHAPATRNAADEKKVPETIAAGTAPSKNFIPSDSILKSIVDQRTDVAEAKLVSIKMEDYYFKPDKITVEQGTTVEWINTGKHAHTVTDEHESWDSGNLEPGEKFSHRFDDKGTFEYYCIPHKKLDMTGKIIVK